MLSTSSTLLPCKVKGFVHDDRFQPDQTGLVLAISKHKNEQLSVRSQTLPSSLFISSGGLGILTNDRNRKMNKMSVRCSLDPGSAPPFPFNLIPGSNWQLWVLGTIVSVVLPFTTSKWGPLLKIKNEAEKMLQTAEDIAEKVEEVAEKVEKMADELEEQLPKDGKLYAALEMVEDIAKETAKTAHRADDLIDKVQEMEEKVEDFMESVDAKAKEKKTKKA
ncbi:hypothetical protein COLO4_11997 [Corchorus olitorius]|uniref:Uncharacterized protein n=1 Tax=Corchorus olitorius TaxID=93759 RepID=A0A1R3K2H6_9ROSI|nr:hypothetical protein COLO4_11997 [Corchorus olitorius]